jgi:predicted transcriptional regulator
MTEEDRAILAFEETQHMDQAHHDEAVRQRFGLSPARYAQRLNVLVRRRDVLEAFPVLVHRLERQAAARLARRERRARRQLAA